jgi:2-alkenal reductase
MTTDRLSRYAILAAAVAVALWFGTQFFQTVFLVARDERPVTPRGDLASFEKTTIDVFQETAPSVVYIFTERVGRTSFGRQAMQQGAGSGFVWDRGGHIITNNHVIDGADRVFVRFDSGEVAPAHIVGTSPDHDLAVLRVSVSANKLKPIPIGKSSDLRIGQAVFAIGNPFGLSRSLTTGVVSALDRALPVRPGREITGVIQTDAAINPGNSGGPLIDSAGRLIGVNSAIISESGSSAGIGFAVPVDTVNRIVPQIIKNGRPARPGIGIQAGPEELAARLNVDGVIIVDVQPGGPADKAGIRGIDRAQEKLGDVIVAVNGERVRTVAELAEAFEKAGVGQKAQIEVLRDGQRRTVEVPLADIS